MLTDVEAFARAAALELVFWRHPGRADGVGVAFRPSTFERARARALVSGPVVSGVLELVHRASGLHVRALSSHQRGRDEEQLRKLLDGATQQPAAADADSGLASAQDRESALLPPHLVLIGADFNEGARRRPETDFPLRLGKRLSLASPRVARRAQTSDAWGAWPTRRRPSA